MNQSLKRNLLTTEKILDVHGQTLKGCEITDDELFLNMPFKNAVVTIREIFLGIISEHLVVKLENKR